MLNPSNDVDYEWPWWLSFFRHRRDVSRSTNEGSSSFGYGGIVLPDPRRGFWNGFRHQMGDAIFVGVAFGAFLFMAVILGWIIETQLCSFCHAL
jgi:hypothetical protein